MIPTVNFFDTGLKTYGYGEPRPNPKPPRPFKSHVRPAVLAAWAKETVRQPSRQVTRRLLRRTRRADLKQAEREQRQVTLARMRYLTVPSTAPV